GYPAVPGGVPQAWERAQVYLGLCERYRGLYQAQLAELHLMMATAPGYSLPLSHPRPLTGSLIGTHWLHITHSGTARGDAYDPPAVHKAVLACRLRMVRPLLGWRRLPTPGIPARARQPAGAGLGERLCRPRRRAA